MKNGSEVEALFFLLNDRIDRSWIKLYYWEKLSYHSAQKTSEKHSPVLLTTWVNWPYKSEEEYEAANVYAAKIVEMLKKKDISVKYDNRDTHKPGFKFAEWEFKGVFFSISHVKSIIDTLL